jgi:integrase
VWEIRVAAGIDPVSGRTLQRSFSFHGSAEQAELRRAEVAAEYADRRAIRRAAPFIDVAELLGRWLLAHHDWRPATWVSARSNVRAVSRDPLSSRRVAKLSPEVMRAAMARWEAAGLSVSVISGRFRVVRSAVGWAHVERILDRNPLSGMRGPARPGTRLHLPVDDVVRLLATSEDLVGRAARQDPGDRRGLARLHKAEQTRLLVRLAADSGARRGELAALQFGDLVGRVLTIERGVSAEQVGPTKTRRSRRLTLGRRTVDLWEATVERWHSRLPAETGMGEWLFASDLAHRQRLTAGALSHWFAQVGEEAGLSGASLHRLRHTVATFLVGRGELLKAQQRLGHRDPSTTLRNYAHALPLEDEGIADDLDKMLRA